MKNRDDINPTWRHALKGLTLRQIARQLGDAIHRDGPFDLAAQLAYWSMLALFPFVIIVLTLSAYLPLHGLDMELIDLIRQVLPGDAARLVESTLHDVIGKQRGWLLGLALLGGLWTASGGVSGTMTALNKAWEIEETRPFWKTTARSLVVTIVATLLLIVAMIGLVIGPVIGHHVFAWFGLGALFDLGWRVARWPIVVLAMMTTLVLVYRVLPDIKYPCRFILPGAAVATLLWIVVSLGFGQYAARLGGYSAVYGTLGAGVVLMTWLYLSGVAVIFGGLVNSILDKAAAKACAAQEAARSRSREASRTIHRGG